MSRSQPITPEEIFAKMEQCVCGSGPWHSHTRHCEEEHPLAVLRTAIIEAVAEAVAAERERAVASALMAVNAWMAYDTGCTGCEVCSNCGPVLVDKIAAAIRRGPA